jgi:hypothetical protein
VLQSIGALKMCEILNKMGRVEDMVGHLGERSKLNFVGLIVLWREG